MRTEFSTSILQNGIHNILRMAKLLSLWPAKIVTAHFEKLFLSIFWLDDSPIRPPVFIIGAPRSGTTLLYQILLNHFRFVYFSNIVAHFCHAPVFALMVARRLFSNRDDLHDYSSVYGRTKGMMGPHEAGEFWYRWFPRGRHVYVPPSATPEKHLLHLRREILGMSKVENVSALFKNTYNTMRIAPILEALPEASFLVCRRDPVDIAQSVLKGRMKVMGRKDLWWSLPPKEIDVIENHPYWDQVVEQVYYIYKQIEEDKQRFGGSHFFDVSYEALCNDTHVEVSHIERFLNSRGVRLTERFDLPTHFPFPMGQQVDDNDYRCIVAKVKQLWQ